jgi:hypothetical protein
LLKPSDHADLEETLRALNVLRERKANAEYYGRINRIVLVAVLALPTGFLALVLVSGIFQGEIGYWPIIIGLGYFGLLYAVRRMVYPKNATISDFMLPHFGFRRSNTEILDEQIADYEKRLDVLQRQRRE